MQINRQSYEEYFLLYADGELNGAEMKLVEEFVAQNPDLAAEFNLIGEAVLQPDESIIFANKERLYRNEDERKGVVLMRWFRFAAAAAVIIMLSVAGWLFVDKHEVRNQPVAVKQTPAVVNTEKEQTPKTAVNESSSEQPVSRTAYKAGKKDAARMKSTNEPAAPRQPIEEEPAVAVTEDAVEMEPLKQEPIITGIAQPEVSLAPIDVAVEPRQMISHEEVLDNAQYASAGYYEQEQGNDMIYFANTSLTKKTKLREVIRKATRYIDRVTSLQ